MIVIALVKKKQIKKGQNNERTIETKKKTEKKKKGRKEGRKERS